MKQSVSWVLCFVFFFGQTIQDVLNLNPNVTNSTGLCGASSATLVLTQMQSTILTFNFTLVNLTLFYFIFFVNVTLVIFTKLLSSSFGPQNSTTNKYHLSGVTLLANWSDSGKYLL